MPNSPTPPPRAMPSGAQIHPTHVENGADECNPPDQHGTQVAPAGRWNWEHRPPLFQREFSKTVTICICCLTAVFVVVLFIASIFMIVRKEQEVQELTSQVATLRDALAPAVKINPINITTDVFNRFRHRFYDVDIPEVNEAGISTDAFDRFARKSNESDGNNAVNISTEAFDRFNRGPGNTIMRVVPPESNENDDSDYDDDVMTSTETFDEFAPKSDLNDGNGTVTTSTETSNQFVPESDATDGNGTVKTSTESSKISKTKPSDRLASEWNVTDLRQIPMKVTSFIFLPRRNITRITAKSVDELLRTLRDIDTPRPSPQSFKSVLMWFAEDDTVRISTEAFDRFNRSSGNTITRIIEPGSDKKNDNEISTHAFDRFAGRPRKRVMPVTNRSTAGHDELNNIVKDIANESGIILSTKSLHHSKMTGSSDTVVATPVANVSAHEKKIDDTRHVFALFNRSSVADFRAG